jgi:hypothetical protein
MTLAFLVVASNATTVQGALIRPSANSAGTALSKIHSIRIPAAL